MVPVQGHLLSRVRSREEAPCSLGCGVLQDYRSEVGEILAGDPQLVQEIQFDLKRFDEEQRRAVQTPPISVTPHTMMVSDCT